MREFNPNNLPKIHGWGMPEGISAPPLEHPELYIEIGCGTGDHALSFSKLNPNKHLIAIERTHNKFNKFLNKFEKFNPSNLSPVHADAILWTAQYLPQNSLSGCFILYPNPYPKKKQSNLRWHNMPYFQYLIQLLKPGASITLATNIKDYADEFHFVIKENFSEHLKLSEFIKIDSREFIPRTAFEKKYLTRGEACYNIILQKSFTEKTI